MISVVVNHLVGMGLYSCLDPPPPLLFFQNPVSAPEKVISKED